MSTGVPRCLSEACEVTCDAAWPALHTVLSDGPALPATEPAASHSGADATSLQPDSIDCNTAPSPQLLICDCVAPEARKRGDTSPCALSGCVR
jgi:hypothetical protein